MHRPVAAALVILPPLLLAGCAASSPTPAPDTTAGEWTVPVPSPNVSASPLAASPTPEPPISTFALICSNPPAGWNLATTWLGKTYPALNVSNLAMVDVGTGNQAGSDWWIVAARANFNGSETSTQTWLTDSMSSADQADAQWINITWGWLDQTHWSDVREARGWKAQDLVTTCLH